MPLQIVRNDITKMQCDAIVNAANQTLLGGGGVDGAIHKAAGPGLLEECRALGGCQVGQAKMTDAYDLPCRYVIHTVGPIWQGGTHGENSLLENSYRNALQLAKEKGCESIAFPLISAGAYGYPREAALRIALDTIRDFLMKNEMLVYLVVFDKAAFQISEKIFCNIQSFIDDHYVDERIEYSRHYRIEAQMPSFSLQECSAKSTLDDLIEQLDESFSQMLFRKIDEKGMTDAECYKKANVDRRLFSKIRNDVQYRPSKVTAIAFAIALQLSLEETEDLLQKAGFALSRSNKFDVIVEYFIENGNYNVFEINEALFAFDQTLLGG